MIFRKKGNNLEPEELTIIKQNLENKQINMRKVETKKFMKNLCVKYFYHQVIISKINYNQPYAYKKIRIKLSIKKCFTNYFQKAYLENFCIKSNRPK